MSKYNDEATQKLIKSMEEMESLLKKSISAGELAKAKEAGRTPLDAIIEALEEGADPNPVSGKSLFAMICAYPFEEPGNPSTAIRTAIRLGVDVTAPVTADSAKELPTVVRSPLADMVLLFQHTGNRELEKRFRTIFKETKPSDIEKMLLPEPRNPVEDKIYIRIPLLCEMFEQHLLRNLQSAFYNVAAAAERSLDYMTLHRIVNEPIRAVRLNGKKLLPVDISDLLAAGRQNVPDLLERIIRRTGDTPLHALVRKQYDITVRRQYHSLADEAQWLIQKGADHQASNREGLTPYGLSCNLGIYQIIRNPSLLLCDATPADMAFEFSQRDRMGRLLLTRMLDGLSTSIRYSKQPLDPSLENSSRSDLNCNYAHFDKGVESVRDVAEIFLQYRAHIPRDILKEYREVFSAALPLAVKADRPELAECLLDMGADPRYCEPGRPPVWQCAALEWGDLPETLNLLRRAKLTDGERQLLMDLHAPFLAAQLADADEGRDVQHTERSR